MPDDDLQKRLRQNESAINDLLHRTKDHEDRLNQGQRQIEANAKSISELIAVVQGVMGRKGLIGENSNHEERLAALEDWKRDIRSFIAGVAFVGAVIGSVFSTVLLWALNYFTQS